MTNRISIHRASTEMRSISCGVTMRLAMDIDAARPRDLPDFANDLLGDDEKSHG
jgi:hypothetical protein